MNDSNSAAQVSIRLYAGFRPCSMRALRTASSSAPRIGPEFAVAEPDRLRVRSMSREIPRKPTRLADRCSSTSCENCTRNHRSMRGQLVDFVDGPAAVEGAEYRPHAAIVRHAQLALERAFLFLRRQARLAALACCRRTAGRSRQARATRTPS